VIQEMIANRYHVRRREGQLVDARVRCDVRIFILRLAEWIKQPASDQRAEVRAPTNAAYVMYMPCIREAVR